MVYFQWNHFQNIVEMSYHVQNTLKELERKYGTNKKYTLFTKNSIPPLFQLIIFDFATNLSERKVKSPIGLVLVF